MKSLILACLTTLSLSFSAQAEDRMNDIYAKLTAAGLADSFYSTTSMEPLPSGEYLLEGLTIAGGTDYTHFAGDGAGGAFVEMPDGRIFYISSEGEFATIAPDFDTALRISLSISSLSDTLRVIKGDVEADRAEWLGWLKSWGMQPTPEEPVAATAALNLLGLAPMEDAFAALHSSVIAGQTVSVTNQNASFVSFAR